MAPIPAGIPDHDRYDRQHWNDADMDRQDARREFLVEESLVPVTFETDRKCQVETGRCSGPFTGVYVEDPSDLDIDHLVPLRTRTSRRLEMGHGDPREVRQLPGRREPPGCGHRPGEPQQGS